MHAGTDVSIYAVRVKYLQKASMLLCKQKITLLSKFIHYAASHCSTLNNKLRLETPVRAYKVQHKRRQGGVTGIDLSKILEGQTQIWGGNVVKTDKHMAISQILGGCAHKLLPKVYAYGGSQCHSCSNYTL